MTELFYKALGCIESFAGLPALKTDLEVVDLSFFISEQK